MSYPSIRSAVCLTVLCVLTGCGTVSPTSTTTSAVTAPGPRPTCCTGPATTATPLVSPSPAAIVAGVLTLTESDGDATLAVPVGTRIAVALTGGTGEPLYVWSDVTFSNNASTQPSVLTSQGSTTHTGGGAQAAFTAASPGRATLSATSDPTCAHDTPPCGAPSTLWSVTLVVS